MAKVQVVAAVKAQLSTWSSLAECPLSGENKGRLTPNSGGAFLSVQFPFSSSERITFGSPGSNLYREEGAFRLLVHVERGSGDEQGREWGAELETLFIGKQFDGVETFTPQSAESDDENDNGQYFVYAVAVPYRFDFFG